MLTAEQVKELDAVVARNPSGFDVSSYVLFVKRDNPNLDGASFEKAVREHLGL